MIELEKIFRAGYGNKLDLNKLAEASPREGIAFVGRSRRNLGVTAFVERIEGLQPYPAGHITVALGGASVLYSFVQQLPFYTAQNIAVLTPPADMPLDERIYYCLAIRANAWRYHGFGREANRSFKRILLPERRDTPDWAKGSRPHLDITAEPLGADLPADFDPVSWQPFRLDDLFQVRKGKRVTKANMRPGKTPFIGSSDRNNGVTARIDLPPLHPAGTLTVCYNGSVGEAFYQPEPYWCSDDVNALYPNFHMTPLRALFVCALVRAERYRFSYGRKWHLGRMRSAELRLPSSNGREPDWAWVDRFMSQRRYSGAVGKIDRPAELVSAWL